MTTMAPSRPSIPPHDHTPRPYAGPSRQEVLAMRRQYCHPSTFLYYREPLMVVEGHMQYLYDETGRRYLDFFAGIVTVSCGHSHPKFLQRLQAQLALIQHTTTIYLHPNFPLMAQRLAGKMPPGLEVTYFVNSGSEANDLAVLMARTFTGNNDVIAVRNSYHGGSPSSMGLTSHATWKFPAQVNHSIHHAINPDPYRSPFRGTPEEIASRSAADIRDLVRYSTPGRVAGFTGDHFWGFEASGVVPDIVTMAKGIGNGLPLAAVTTRREIAEALTQRIHFNTFGGNPVSMAAGLAVLDIIEEDGLQENARITGARLKAGLMELMARHRLIGDVRGRGLMLGVELVLDRETKEPATRETLAIWEAAREMGLLIGKGGLDANVLRIKPPMCINSADVDFALEVLDEALRLAER